MRRSAWCYASGRWSVPETACRPPPSSHPGKSALARRWGASHMNTLALCRAAARTIRASPRMERTCKFPPAAPAVRPSKSSSTPRAGRTSRSRGISASSSFFASPTHNMALNRTFAGLMAKAGYLHVTAHPPVILPSSLRLSSLDAYHFLPSSAQPVFSSSV